MLLITDIYFYFHYKRQHFIIDNYENCEVVTVTNFHAKIEQRALFSVLCNTKLKLSHTLCLKEKCV